MNEREGQKKRSKPVTKAIGEALGILSAAALVGAAIFSIPTPLEWTDLGSNPIPKDQLIGEKATHQSLAPGIPHGEVPDYSVDGFNYSSTLEGKKQWNLRAAQAHMYDDRKLVHAKSITAFLYDDNGNTTLITAQEAKFRMSERDLELFGDVITQQPDGFGTFSQYLRYLPKERRMLIPEQYPVHGGGVNEEDPTQSFAFKSMGMDSSLKTMRIELPRAVTTSMVKKPEPGLAGVPEVTTIQSDHCLIDRKSQIANYRMFDSRKRDDRFVKVRQPGLFAKARTADLNYGELSSFLKYLSLEKDVYIREFEKTPSIRPSPSPSPSALPPGSLAMPLEPRPFEEPPKKEMIRYATAGRAEFDTARDQIILKEFPQVYQDHDTVTGDIIIVHRDTDTVEVEHGNAFSKGEE